MKKAFILLSIFRTLGLNAQTIEILDKTIVSGKAVNVRITNNTKKDYCFIFDTIYYASGKDYKDPFYNLDLYLIDDKNRMLPIIQEIFDHRRYTALDGTRKVTYTNKGDTLVINQNEYVYGKDGFLSTILIKKGTNYKIKIPFFLVVKYMIDKSHMYYDLDKKKKYRGKIFYAINREFIKKNLARNKIDSIEKRGIKIFIGKLVSNKVPLIIDE